MEMNEPLQPEIIRTESLNRAEGLPRYMSKVYGLMCLGLSVTAVMALLTVSIESLFNMVFSSMISFYVLIGIELLLVAVLSARVHKMSMGQAIGGFLLYSLVNGLTMSVIFLAFSGASISKTFFITAGTFAAMSVLGYTTKKDLTSLGGILFAALIGLIIASIVNFFTQSSTFEYIISFAGVIIFMGLTAYDTQKIKAYYETGDQRTIVMGALSLYLDFINLFLFLLRLFGGSRD